MPSLTFNDIQNFSPIHTTLFVETGTNIGTTVDEVKWSFKHVFSIELDPTLAQGCKERFTDDTNVTIIQGDSAVVLPYICKTLDEPTFFWLDGHWCGGNTAKGPLDCPLLHEIKAIMDYCTVECVVAIDDARLFDTIKDEDWSGITIESVVSIVESRLINLTTYPSDMHPQDRLILHLKSKV